MTNKVFDLYVRHGLKVIPLLPLSKKPFFDGWQDASLYDPERCRRFLEGRADYNLGLLLGDIVDVEGVSQEANAFLETLIGDTPHPKYRSSKSVHHLFLTPDPKLTRFVTGKIEFRGHRHQSVLPPSRHEDGTEYQWLQGTKFPIPPMPDRLLAFYRSKVEKASKPSGDYVKEKGPACGRGTEVHRDRLKLERRASVMLGVRWECRRCRQVDLRPTCRRIKRASR